ncbi:MAG: S66 peptidase family protein [Nanoarchaeota archaeon]
MKLIKPKPLEKGDVIALIAPSSGVAGLFPHRLDAAINFLNLEGYYVKEYSTTRKTNLWESAPAKERAKDIMKAFLDKDIKAIICTIGGNTSNQTLEYLDFGKIRQNPKIFCGYSDISVLHYALHTQSGLLTFYGPAAITQFGEYPKPLSYTVDYFYKAIQSTDQIGSVLPSSHWTDELLDWNKKLDLIQERTLQSNPGYEWLRNGVAQGPLIGGCISSIAHLQGTKYWPNHNKRIFFWESPEGEEFGKGEPLASVDAYLADLKLSRVFEQISGMIVGRPYKYSINESTTLKQKILERTAGYKFPILYGVDIGHTDPQITVPLGAQALIDSKKNVFEILESGTSR